MNLEKILQVEHLTKTYGTQGNPTLALQGISFDLFEGEMLGIMGPSGSGKTTLLNCIATMIKPTSGKIHLKKLDLASFNNAKLANYRGKDIGYLFQEFELLDNLTVKENIILPLSLHGTVGKKALETLQPLATLFDLRDILDKFPGQISGGQKQRVAAARALISNPSIVLADEPTGSLDSKNSKILMDKLTTINKTQQKSIMMVTHDASAASFCSRILFIQDGKLFHELRKRLDSESRDEFYKRIITVIAQLGGGSEHVL